MVYGYGRVSTKGQAKDAMPYIEDPEMHKVCEKLLVKLNKMSDESFNNMDFAV